MLSRDQILGCDDLPRKTVYVSEWGGEVIVRGMNGTERDEFEGRFPIGQTNGSHKVNFVNLRAWCAVKCCIDESGKRLFADKDVEALGAKSGAALDTIMEAVLELNAVRPQDVEALRKNLGSGLSETSTSA